MPAIRKLKALRKPLPAEALLSNDPADTLADGLENALDLLDVKAGEAEELSGKLKLQADAAAKAQAAAAIAKREAADAEALASITERQNRRLTRYAKAGGIGGLIGHFTGLGTWKGAGAAVAIAWFTDTEG